MSKRSDAMKRKAKKNLQKARVQLSKIKARAKVELARHTRAFKLAAKRYKGALKNS
jgi:F0F1-type ATP synthase membrane subunit b/b'